MGKRWAAEIVQALSEQTVVVLGTEAATVVLSCLAQQLAALRRQRDEVGKEVERLVLAHPLHPVPTNMPRLGLRTAARLLIDVATRALASAAHLATYAGLAPVDAPVRFVHPRRTSVSPRKQTAQTCAVPVGLCSVAATRSPRLTTHARSAMANVTTKPSLRSPGAAVLFAMLRDGTLYSPPATALHSHPYRPSVDRRNLILRDVIDVNLDKK